MSLLGISDSINKQAGAELGQTQVKLGLVFTSVNLHRIDEKEILLTI